MSVRPAPRPALLLATGLFAVLLGMPAGSKAGAGQDEAETRLLLFPELARIDAAGGAQARIEAWVYENERRPGASSLFARYLGLDLDELPAADHERFLQRTQLFRVDGEGRRRLRVSCGDGGAVRSPRSRGNGRIGFDLVFGPAAAEPRPRWIDCRAELDGGLARAEGRVLLLPERGLSVVSDIDDTIKLSQVRDRRELLLNTFVREFQAVPGMAERYRAIAAADPGASFHYLSGSPYQLYPPLAGFLDTAGFPPGSLHLRDLRLRSEVFGHGGGTAGHKLAQLRRLLAGYPGRRFLLIGDSGERDPETYGQVAREFPGRIAGIAIRDVTGQAGEDARYASAFAGVDPLLWRIVEDPRQIPLAYAEPPAGASAP